MIIYIIAIVSCVTPQAFYLSIVIGLPIQVLVNISRGKAFTPANVRAFTLIATLLGICFVVAVLGPSLLHVSFRNKIPSELVPKPWYEYLVSISISCLVLLQH